MGELLVSQVVLMVMVIILLPELVVESIQLVEHKALVGVVVVLQEVLDFMEMVDLVTTTLLLAFHF